MLISLLFAVWSMGFHQHRSMKQIATHWLNQSSIAMPLMIISGGSAFKQVLLDGGWECHSTLSCWRSPFTTYLRLADRGCFTNRAWFLPLGILQPDWLHRWWFLAVLIQPWWFLPSVPVSCASHVNDAGFWMFQEYFDLTVKQTLAIWTVLETWLSIWGLVFVLILNAIVH